MLGRPSAFHDEDIDQVLVLTMLWSKSSLTLSLGIPINREYEHTRGGIFPKPRFRSAGDGSACLALQVCRPLNTLEISL